MTTMYAMFDGAAFDQPIGTDVLGDEHGMFRYATVFNQLSGWDVSSVTNMQAMFHKMNFNQPTVTGTSLDEMKYMFFQAFKFNQPIGTGMCPR